MAHHNSTPRTVLDAPSVTQHVVSEQYGFTRLERRHGVPKMEPEALDTARLAGRNVPATSTRERKVRKGRKARHNRTAS